MADVLTLLEMGSASVDVIGSKARSLGAMAAAGLPVPPAFCISAEAFCRLRGKSVTSDQDLCAEIALAYERLGECPVAVRSSSLLEDGETTSGAGQHDTILAVHGRKEVLEAVAQCWASLNSERSIAYQQNLKGRQHQSAMAVIVQTLVCAEVAGVLFTCDPLDAQEKNMRVEASWGLGTSVVSGRVTPDSYTIDRASGEVQESKISRKSTMETPAGLVELPAEKQLLPCLDEPRLRELADLGRRVEHVFGGARDVEWAWAKGRFWLLQARPITANSAAELEAIRQQEIANLRNRVEGSGTVWSQYNLSEILPAPTPMTWSIVRRLMAGAGGLGSMYRDLGFNPDPSLDQDGVFDLVCGRPYCNLSREPRMYFPRLPFKHSFEAMKAAPRKAFYPTPVLETSNFGFSDWMKLIAVLPTELARLARHQILLKKAISSFPSQFRGELAPSFKAAASQQAAIDLTRLDHDSLLHSLDSWIQRTLIDFARNSLKATALAGFQLASVEQEFARHLEAEQAKTALAECVVGIRPDDDADLLQALCDLKVGRMTRSEFLRRFGHRGRNEMELSEPRWAERPDNLDEGASSDYLAPERRYLEEVWMSLARRLNLKPAQAAKLYEKVMAVREFIALRETAKHFLLMGYAQIRRILIEFDNRFELNGGVFYLTLADLPRLLKGEDLSNVIQKARRRRALCLSLQVRSVIFSDDLDVVGRAVPVAGGERLQGVPLSPGVVEGPALVLRAPQFAGKVLDKYVLICPSTDPAWIQMFGQACGLVMETGGVLSHGAILAREFGLPAVAGIPGVLNSIRNGQPIRVNGSDGSVTILRSMNSQSNPTPSENR
jgi:pyruvate,water dikinase